MKKIITLFVALVLSCSVSFSQRYLQEVFTDVQVTSNVTYGVNATVIAYQQLGQAIPQQLKCDIYEPVGDTATSRPVVLYFHTGNFLPTPQNGSPSGTKVDSNVVEMCSRLAKMGYVVASCDYRLGWNPVASTQDERVYTLINAAYRGVQDCRTAIRFFRMTEAEMSNPYGIDPTRIAVWGQGTGGYISFASATLNNYSDIVIPKFIHDVEVAPGVIVPLPMVIQEVNGDIYGTSVGINPNDGDTLCYINHPAYSSDFNVMVNLGGACGDSSWVTANDIPMISFHSPTDPFAPYNVGTVIVPGFNLPVVEVSGSGHVQQMANAFGLNDVFQMADDAGDVYTTAANTFNDGNFGLYPLNRPSSQLADSAPWEWWAADNPNNSNGLMTNPNMSAEKGMMFLDSIQMYAAPRMMCALMLAGSPCEEIVVEGPANDECMNAVDINTLFTGGLQMTMSDGPFSNEGATAEDPSYPLDADCFVAFSSEPSVDNTVWFTFEGDGQLYNINTSDCNGTATFTNSDTQMAIYSGTTCEGLTLVDCVDDMDTQGSVFWAGLPFQTADNITYYVMVDGFNYTAGGSGGLDSLSSGDFCLDVTQITVNINENELAGFRMFPNPTHNNFTIAANAKIESINIFNLVGEIVATESNVNAKTYEVKAQLAKGIYMVDVYTSAGKNTQKLIVE